MPHTLLTPSAPVLTPSEDIQTDPIAEAIKKYRTSEASLETLAKDLGMSHEALRKKMKVFCLLYSGSNEEYRNLVREHNALYLIEAEEELDKSRDSVEVTRAGTKLRHAEWKTAKIMPDIFGEKRQVQNDITVTVRREIPQPVVVEAEGRLIENTKSLIVEDNS